MVPSTLTSLFLFVVLLLPGFAYLAGTERHGTERHLSIFRETVSVVAASVTTEVLVLALFALVRWRLPSRTPDVGALIRGGNAYIAVHYRSLAVWVLCMLAVATALAYVVTWPKVRRGVSRIPGFRSYPHTSRVSAWWLILESWAKGRQVELGCILTDGSYISGFLGSFSNSADDTADRDVNLVAPIQYRPPSASEPLPHPVSAVNIPASRIVNMFVTYLEEETTTTQPTVTALEAQPALEPAAQGQAVAQPAEAPSEGTTAVPQA